MNNVWFFGDSFCHPCQQPTPDWWWGKKFADHLNYVVELKSQGGSSIDFMSLELQENIKNFKEDDMVIISYTTPYRFFLYNKNISLINDLKFDNNIDIVHENHYDKNIVDAVKKFLLYLYDDKYHLKLWYSTIFYVQNTLVPLIKSKNTKVIEFYSFKPPIYNDFLPFNLKDLPIAEDFILDITSKFGFKSEVFLQSNGHFGDENTPKNFNLDWSKYMLEQI